MPPKRDGYKTCSREGEATLIERKSRFIGYLAHASNEEEAKEYIDLIRDMHPEANHHVWCYVLGGGTVVRASDDGEPSGTAGRPVSEVILREGLTDVVCVVVRYFGGILLGAGGLIRAYASGAKGALDAATISNMVPMQQYIVRVPYHFHGKVTSTLNREGITPEAPEYAENVSFRVTISMERAESFEGRIADLTAGTGLCERGGIVYMPEE